MTRLLITTAVVALMGTAQEGTPDKLTIPFRDASRPGTVRVSVQQGAITVKGYSGKDVLVEAVTRRESDRRRGRDAAPEPDSAGMKRIFNASTGLSAEEENNVVRISTRNFSQPVDIVVQVPLKTSLKLNGMNTGSITVENVEGDIEVSHMNGAVTLTGVSGSAVAHSMNGAINAVLKRVDSSKSMSFSTMNGKIDVTFPPDIKADLKIHTERGEVYSDFDVAVAASAPKVEESKDGKGRYRVTTDSSLNAKVNGGGQDISFKSMNGNIYIRKAK